MFIAACWLIYALIILVKLLGHITVSWLGIFTPIIVLFSISVVKVFLSIRQAKKEAQLEQMYRNAFLNTMKDFKK